MKIGDMVRIMLGSYQGKTGIIECIFSRVKRFQMRGITDPLDTIYEIKLLEENESIYFAEKHLQLVNEQDVAYYPPVSAI
jgi:hypothetical protein